MWCMVAQHLLSPPCVAVCRDHGRDVNLECRRVSVGHVCGLCAAGVCTYVPWTYKARMTPKRLSVTACSQCLLRARCALRSRSSSAQAGAHVPVTSVPPPPVECGPGSNRVLIFIMAYQK